MNRKAEIVIIGGSAGSFTVVRKILSALEERFPIPVVMCLHRLRDVRNGFKESLNVISKLEVKEPHDKERIMQQCVYLSPANYHLLIEKSGTFALSTGAEENYSRPSIDVSFETAGWAYKERMVGVLLSGANTDGALGLYQAKRFNAYTVVQDPAEAAFKIMPEGAISYFQPDKIMSSDQIVDLITSLEWPKD